MIYINFFPLPFCYNFTPLPLSPELTKVTGSHVPCLSHPGQPPHQTRAAAFPGPSSHSWCCGLKIQLSHGCRHGRAAVRSCTRAVCH